MKTIALSAALGSLLLSGCEYLSVETWRAYSPTSMEKTPVMMTTADVRIITQRPNPETNGNPAIFCAEPSPDVAKALSSAASAEASVQGKGGVSGQGTLSVATAEQLAQLTQRVPAIQALRDGLYRACEAYGNGVIGKNAYALILSRYGDLLVTMILAEAAAGSANSLAVLTAPNATVPPPPNPPPPSPAPAKAGAATPPAAPDKAASQEQAEPSDATGNAALPAKKGAIAFKPELPRPTQSMLQQAIGFSQSDSRPDGAGFQLAAAGDVVPPAAPAGGTDKPQPAPPPTPATAQSLEEMQHSYFDQTLGKIGPMFVMCANVLDTDSKDKDLAASCQSLISGLGTAAVVGAPFAPLWELCRGGTKPAAAPAAGAPPPPTEPVAVACAAAAATLAAQLQLAPLMKLCTDVLDPTRPHVAAVDPNLAKICGSLMQAMVIKATAGAK